MLAEMLSLFTSARSRREAEQRLPLYRDLVKVAENTVEAARVAVEKLEADYPVDAFQQPELRAVRDALAHYAALANKVLDQTRRRVFDGETVPARRRSSRSASRTWTSSARIVGTPYGHKVFATTGASGLIVDCVVERGIRLTRPRPLRSPSARSRVLDSKPEQVVSDGGFSSRDNLDEIKSLGIRDVVFSKAPGIAIKEMINGASLYQRLTHFRVGIEGITSFLKRSFGWDRCAWRLYGSFRAYTWGSVIAENLVMRARHALV